MKLFIGLALLAALMPSPVHPTAFAQSPGATSVSAPSTDALANPLQVKPVAPAAQPSQESPAASAIRAKLESFGYADISRLDRDSAGRWHAHATKDNSTVEVVVSKGGRILPQQH
jgi:hypothetical protein